MSPFSIFAALEEQSEYAFLMESVTGPRKMAEFSFVGAAPSLVARARDGVIEVLDGDGKRVSKSEAPDPLRALGAFLHTMRSPGGPFRFMGGAVGYVAYDYVRRLERLPNGPPDDMGFPDLEMAFYDRGLVYDHASRRAYSFSLGKDEPLRPQDIRVDGDIAAVLEPEELGVLPSRDDFEERVKTAKDYIAAGEVFQLVLSKRYRMRVKGSLIPFYGALRRMNPSPYMFYLKSGKRRLVGSSPEMLVRVSNGIVETYPIAGTRPAVADRLRNAQLKRELLADAKERAEHLMLVDLARNDVGRVCEYGTVKVPEFMKVKRFSHVQHIVSKVVGRLRNECDALDAFRAVFPAGTVTGAPKVRAMELIDELEDVRRGPYAGAVGYLSYSGDADFAIAIRSLFASGREAFVQAGAGIVADSDPAREWDETEYKAQALLQALRGV